MEQIYTVYAGTKTTTNDDNVVIRGKPSTATERILVNIEGLDSTPNPGDQVSRFKSALAANAYFNTMMGRSNAFSLKSLSPPQVAPVTGKPCVMFTLEGRYPEKTR